MNHHKYRPDIDGLRTIAVFSVIGFHAFPSFVKGGFIGVDVFFVISGFLISGIIFTGVNTNSFSFFQFYSRRIRRIFPALIFVIAVCYAIGWLDSLPTEFKQLGKHLAGASAFVANFILWDESGYFDASADTKPLLHLWSLGIEEQFYIFWPLFIWLLAKARLNFLYALGGFVAASFLLNIYQTPEDPVASFYSPLTRFWELGVGGILAFLVMYKGHILDSIDRRFGTAPRNCFAFVGLCLIAAAIVLLDKGSVFPGWWALLPTIGASLLIAAGPNAWFNSNILSSRIFVWLGSISYPLYLWHWPILLFLPVVVTEFPSRGIRVFAILLSIVMAWITYRLLETPARASGKNDLKVAVLVFLMTVIGSVGYATYRKDGFASRIPKAFREIIEIDAEATIAGYRVGTCFLPGQQDETAFADCSTHPNDAAAPSTFLWGDSHAAHLYPGLLKRIGETDRLTQLTGCTPILGMTIEGRPKCRQINNYIFRRIAIEKPDRVVLASAWGNFDWRQIDGTIKELKKAGIKRIDLVGPVPLWRDGLPKSLYRFYRFDIPLHRIPKRMHFGLLYGPEKIDGEMRKYAESADINYISPYSILCNSEGCLTMIGDNMNSLITWDAGHMNPAGSEYLVSRFPE